QKKEGEKLSRMLMTIVKKAMTSGNPPLWRAYLELMQWTELSSIDNFPITQIIDESLARDMSTVPMRKIVVVKRNEAMHCAELFVENEWKKNCPIHVITDSEEDAARFYKRACVLWPQINTQLNWRGKKFGWVKSEPWIAIGTRKYFTSTRDQIGDRSKVAAVFVHAESVIDDLSPQCVEFEKDNIDEFLVHLFVMASVTVKRVREIERANLKSTEMLADLMKTWPTVYQVLKEDEIRKILEESFIPSELSMNEPPLLSEKLRMYARHAVRMTMDKSMIPTQLQKHVENNAAAYVNSAFHALEAMILGEDYIVYLERSNDSISQRVSLQTNARSEFALQQFVELKHGLEMTEHRIAKAMRDRREYFKGYNRALLLLRSNPCRYQTSIDNFTPFGTSVDISRMSPHLTPHNECKNEQEFPVFVAETAKSLIDHLVIVVCPTLALLHTTVVCLRSCIDRPVAICETTRGISIEMEKRGEEHEKESLPVVCTTAAYFMNWTSMPHAKIPLKILTGNESDNHFLVRKACDLVDVADVVNVYLWGKHSKEV
ncbi:hypothetical protein PFISCL1PPCAC_28777, partial [Pristionchus fissidentatus]